MINNPKNTQFNTSKRTMILAFTMIYLFGFSGGLFLYPFLGYQGLIAFGTLFLGIVLLVLIVGLQNN